MEAIRVLLVDDEVIIKRVLCEKVDWGRFDMKIVGTVSSAQEAMDFLNTTLVDLVIVDIKMPFMDGNDLIEKVVALSAKKLHFLVLSAYTEFNIVRRSFTLGVYDYLQKSDINTTNMYNILIKLRNEIIKERSREKGNSSDGRQLEMPIGPAKVSNMKQYTVLLVRMRDMGFDNSFSDKIKQDASRIKIMIDSRMANLMYFFIEHSQKSNQGIDYEKSEAISILRQWFQDDIYEPGFGVSTTGQGGLIDYLKREAEQALEGEFYAQNGQSVFYYEHQYASDSSKEQRLLAEYWTVKIKEQIKCLNLKDASAQIGELMTFIYKSRLERARCHQLVFDVYYFFISYLKNHDIINLDNEIESDPHTIDNIIRQFDRFNKLGEWIAVNLNHIQNSFILKFKSETIEIIKIYVGLNLNTDLALNKFAEYYGINGSYISHLFKKKVGVSLNKYICEVRLNQAKHYLINTNMKILDICELVGYNNPEHFSRMFKERYGKSPNQYREEAII